MLKNETQIYLSSHTFKNKGFQMGFRHGNIHGSWMLNVPHGTTNANKNLYFRVCVHEA